MRATEGKLQALMLRAGGNSWPVPALVVGSIVFVAALSLFLFVRRATGALTDPLSATQLVATAVVMCTWALLVREFTAKRPLFFWISLGAMALVAVACSFPAVRMIDCVVWLPAIGLIAALPFAPQLKTSLPDNTMLNSLDEDLSGEQILQQITRVKNSDGKESIRGTLTAHFETGDRNSTVFTSFCPPFELLPQVEAHVTDDFEAEVKLVQVLHNGAQLEVRLADPADEPTAISIEFFASERV